VFGSFLAGQSDQAHVTDRYRLVHAFDILNANNLVLLEGSLEGIEDNLSK
jgi:hypothetical protein